MSRIAMFYDYQDQIALRRQRMQLGGGGRIYEPLPKSKVWEFMSAIKNKFEMFTENSGTIDDEVYFHFDDRFDFPDDQWNWDMVLLRSIYVQEKYRGKRLAREVLARAVAASDETGCCILGVVRPFEMLLPDDGKEAREFFTTNDFCAYSSSIGKRARMMARFRNAGFDQLSVADLKDCDEETAAFVYVPALVDEEFKERITKRLV